MCFVRPRVDFFSFSISVVILCWWPRVDRFAVSPRCDSEASVEQNGNAFFILIVNIYSGFRWTINCITFAFDFFFEKSHFQFVCTDKLPSRWLLQINWLISCHNAEIILMLTSRSQKTANPKTMHTKQMKQKLGIFLCVSTVESVHTHDTNHTHVVYCFSVGAEDGTMLKKAHILWHIGWNRSTTFDAQFGSVDSIFLRWIKRIDLVNISSRN